MKKPSQHLPQLNLPPVTPSISVTDDGILSIFDPLRNKAVALTPEEWVRQHFVGWLTGHLGYPASFVVNELGLKVNGRQRRADTVVFDTHLHELMVVEYKRPSVEITQKVFDQIVRYNMTFVAPYVAVSNGLRHFCCRINFANHTYTFLKQFPRYDDLISPDENI